VTDLYLEHAGRLEGAGARGFDWTARIVCVDVEDRRRRHVCRTCEAPLPPRRVYCDKKCELAFDQNHFWAPAKSRALKANLLGGPDGQALELVADRELTEDDILELIARRREELAEVLERRAGRRSRIERVRAYLCEHCAQPTTAPEVNHISPVVGGNRSSTCKNHEENLEVLCHACHLIATAAQRASRSSPAPA
jgi:5-methylcytosine-specific restriction endonuclease McrA